MTVALDDDTVRRLRLANQQLVAPALIDPAAVVSHLVAMQAQEYAMAKWAIGLRLADGGSDEAVESACNEGHILRLHALRPTWHFVAAEDIRMVLQVTAKRVHQ
ncbi:MAG TPA: crosslink repair DNA glycosylase YcaQ family protein, partial [Lapillicoccus sp.]|nr:crosslink repair DNA glycosylase YcaQ family protein [Lapillicoccus sp.]